MWNILTVDDTERNSLVEVYENDVLTVEIRVCSTLNSIDAFIVTDGEYARMTIRSTLSPIDKARAKAILLKRVQENGTPGIYLWNSMDVSTEPEITEDIPQLSKSSTSSRPRRSASQRDMSSGTRRKRTRRSVQKNQSAKLLR
jgi:hypothetical protein